MTTATVVVRPEDACVRIGISGEIDLDNADTVEEQLAAAIPNETTAVVLELGTLEYLDSAGLRVLFALAARLEVLQIAMRVHVPQGSPARRVLQLSGFEGVAALEG
ncbi:STAS domain-containing protein [Actinomycetospora sp. CA-101289]|uniref:STAS domain-containing protein n=1 Tax=Actinomycetospora sp. CA-101289 TaxID=3239893 RepID=UPI003D989FA2